MYSLRNSNSEENHQGYEAKVGKENSDKVLSEREALHAKI
jgi:hypothetical protein